MGDDAKFSPLGLDLFGEQIVPLRTGPLGKRFTFPPFSVLNARSDDWQERKAAWLAMGIKSELGRSGKAIPGGGTGANSCWQFRADKYVSLADSPEAAEQFGGSIFDPVLCELMYKWFAPDGAQIVDPFAGGSVRGIVASLLGLHYWGCELNPDQVASNEEQAAAICGAPLPEWHCGDARELLDSAPMADFIMSCPPYGDLERYSDDPRDLSTMEYHTFMAAYKRIILRCSQKLKDGGRACFVVGDFRDKRTGNFRGFVADTIRAFQECGLALFNDAVLVTAVGSLPIRVSAQFDKSRKLGKTHQNVLIFRK